MASTTTISIGWIIEDVGNGMRRVIMSAEDLRRVTQAKNSYIWRRTTGLDGSIVCYVMDLKRYVYKKDCTAESTVYIIGLLCISKCLDESYI